MSEHAISQLNYRIVTDSAMLNFLVAPILARLYKPFLFWGRFTITRKVINIFRVLMTILLQRVFKAKNVYHESTFLYRERQYHLCWPIIVYSLPGEMITEKFMVDTANFFAAIGMREQSVVFDIGAHIGRNTLVYSILNRGGQIYSFEPHPINFRTLQKNIAANACANVQSFNFGLSDFRGEHYLGMPDKRQHERYNYKYNKYMLQSGLFSFHAKERDGKADVEKGVVCKFDKIDNVVVEKGINKVDFIKIDAEGHELFVLKGAVKTLKRLRPVIQIEINAFALSMSQTGVKDIVRFFEEQAYELYYFEDNVLKKLELALIEQGKFRIAFADIAYLFDMICLPKKNNQA